MKHVEIERTTDAPTLEPAKQLLWDAAAYMEKHGWCRGIEFDGRVCAVNAIAHCLPNPASCVDGDAWDVLKAFLGVASIPRWSDASDQATVVAAMRAAALS